MYSSLIVRDGPVVFRINAGDAVGDRVGGFITFLRVHLAFGYLPEAPMSEIAAQSTLTGPPASALGRSKRRRPPKP